MQTNKEAKQVTLSDLGICCGKTFREPSPAEHPKARTSASSSRRSSELSAVPFMSLDLTPGHGNLLGESYWELISPWLGGAWMLNTGVSPNDARESSLSQILQDAPPIKYYLSPKACLGILRRASERGKALPPKLERALSDVLGADELTQSLPDEAAEVLDGLSPDGTPDFRSGVRSILRAAAGGSGGALRSGLRLCAVLLAMVTLCAVVHMSAQKDPVNAVSAVGALGICAACLGGMQSMISLASETVTRLSDYSACLLPVMASAMAMSGGTVSAGTLYAGTALFSGLLSRLIARLLLPGVSVYLVVAAAEAALADSLLSELREFVGWLISKSLRVMLFVFTGYLTVTGVISGSADAAAVRATKAAVSGMIPVVGSILSDASETLLASASALKSSMGVFGMLAVLAICLAPFLKIGAQYLLLKGTAAVSGTIGMPQQVKLVKHAATAMGYLLAMTGACALMLLISVVCFLKVVG